MAVSQMRRVQLLVHSSHRASLIKDLQDLEIIHINDLNEQEDATGDVPAENEVRDIIRGIENDLSRLQSTINYLAGFEAKKGFLAGMMGGGPVVSSQEYKEATKEVSHGEWRGICDQCQSLQDEFANSNNRENRLRSDRENLRLWGNLDVSIEEIQDTEQTAIRIGIVPASTYNSLLADIDGSEIDMAFEIVGETKTEIQLVAIFPKADEQEASAILTRYGFSLASLPLSSGTVSDRLKAIEQEMAEIVAQREDIEKKSAQLAVHREKLMTIYDHMAELLGQEQVRESFVTTEHTFVVDGWVRKKDAKKLESELASKYEEIEIGISEPLKDDEPPVDLELRGPAAPFQMVTRLYGIPTYKEIDPTPLIAPFFAFFFGICITDAGYGFVVALVAYFAAKKASGGGKHLMQLLIMAGIATIIVGALTGGWFGININPELIYKVNLDNKAQLDSGVVPDNIRQSAAGKGVALSGSASVVAEVSASARGAEEKATWLITDGDKKYTMQEEASSIAFYKPRALTFLTKVRLLDPQGSGQMIFFGAIIVIGFIHVWFGFFVKLCIDFRDRDLKAAFMDELPWVLAMLLFAVWLVLWRTGASPAVLQLLVAAIIICCFIVFAFSGRESENIAGRLGTGAFELYTKVTGTAGDILSYMRLFALGLATGIIGGVVNTMAGMLWGSLIGKFIAIGIFVGGHIFNLVINALGGFIHTARLQFVEFFTKFYEGGGEEFRPFKREHTYVTVVDLESPQRSK